MSGQHFKIKQNDTGPDIIEDLYDSLGAAVDAAAANAIEFHLVDRDTGTTVVNAAATADGVPINRVRYQWQPADTVTAGRYLREWQVELADGSIITVPNGVRGYPVTITDDLI